MLETKGSEHEGQRSTNKLFNFANKLIHHPIPIDLLGFIINANVPFV